jgi:hypothetical protein
MRQVQTDRAPLTAVAVEGLVRRAYSEAKGAIHADDGLVEPLNVARRF